MVIPSFFCMFTRGYTCSIRFDWFPCLTKTDGHPIVPHVPLRFLSCQCDSFETTCQACRFTWPVHTNSIFCWLGTFPLWSLLNTIPQSCQIDRPTPPVHPRRVQRGPLSRVWKGVSPSARTSEGRACRDDLWLWHVISGWGLQPLWKIWVRQWEGIIPYMKWKDKVHVPNHQTIIIN